MFFDSRSKIYEINLSNYADYILYAKAKFDAKTPSSFLSKTSFLQSASLVFYLLTRVAKRKENFGLQFALRRILRRKRLQTGFFLQFSNSR